MVIIVKKKPLLLMIICLILPLFISGCDLFKKDNKETKEEYDKELDSSTGKWYLLDDNTTYFSFDGTKNVMTFEYYENGSKKINGKYRVIYRGEGNDVLTPLTFIFDINGVEEEDWLSCYVDDFKTDFTQFTIMEEEKDLGMIDGNIYSRTYRISELPYKMGTYVKEGKEHKQDKDNCSGVNNYYIPTGTYTLQTGESFTFLVTKPKSAFLFQYKNGDEIVEGLYWVAQDKKTIYLYIEHDPYTKVTKADKDNYDTTFDLNYPPDFYLRGDFSNSNSIVINDLYHHTYSPTLIQDSVWVFGTYSR